MIDPYTKEKFWLVHGVIETHPLEVGLKQVCIYNQKHQNKFDINTYHFLEISWDILLRNTVCRSLVFYVIAMTSYFGIPSILNKILGMQKRISYIKTYYGTHSRISGHFQMYMMLLNPTTLPSMKYGIPRLMANSWMEAEFCL